MQYKKQNNRTNNQFIHTIITPYHPPTHPLHPSPPPPNTQSTKFSDSETAFPCTYNSQYHSRFTPIVCSFLYPISVIYTKIKHTFLLFLFGKFLTWPYLASLQLKPLREILVSKYISQNVHIQKWSLIEICLTKCFCKKKYSLKLIMVLWD